MSLTKEQKRKYHQDYNKKNKDKIRAQRLRYYQKNRKKILRKQKKMWPSYFAANKERIIQRQKNYYKNVARFKYYGITKQEYETLLAKQKNRCAICRHRFGKKIYIDHNSSRVRGLLCNTCNLDLGGYERMLKRKNVAKYLQG